MLWGMRNYPYREISILNNPQVIVKKQISKYFHMAKYTTSYIIHIMELHLVISDNTFR